MSKQQLAPLDLLQRYSIPEVNAYLRQSRAKTYKDIKDGKLPSGKETTRKVLLENLNTGGGGMPPFEKLISQEEKDNVIAYISTL